MSRIHDESLLEILLNSWERNNTILVNLLRAVPAGGLDAKAAAGSPSVAEMFAHMHYVRMVFISEDAPEFATELRYREWIAERDPVRLERLLTESSNAVQTAVRSRIEAGRNMDRHYDHPVLFLQHMIWHEGYHHGQIKLALKSAGTPLADEDAGPITWRVWTGRSVHDF